MTHIEFIYFDLGNVLINFDHSRAWQKIALLTGIPPEHAEQIIFNSGLQTQYEKGEFQPKSFTGIFASKPR